MKKVAKSMLLVVAMLVSGVVFGQNKIGHINTYELMKNLPEYQLMSDSLERSKAFWQQELETGKKEYEKLQYDIETKKATWSKAVYESKMGDLENLAMRIQQREQVAQNDLAEQNERMQTTLIDIVKKAASETAKEKGYSVVMDSSSLIYAAPSDDLTELVKAKLNARANAKPQGPKPVGQPAPPSSK